jgi:hypothetical protein
MDRFTLKMFFYRLLELSYNDLKPGWGNPCSHLLEVMCIRQEPFLDKIMGDYTNHSHEFRLNSAGVKMNWRVDNKETRKFTCNITGDQAREYPLFVEQARNLIKRYQFNRR